MINIIIRNWHYLNDSNQIDMLVEEDNNENKRSYVKIVARSIGRFQQSS